ncbi:MAG TPA: glycoside hydrolase family 3 N-terminal domain-containing protein [Acidimicrobiales bacterium]|nr:glycoside hydrolase family 3 N-terminal domain-containing protein [Acidimicrobiales bacterium]
MTGSNPYQDPSLPVDERVDDLLGRMTLDEKLSQLGCVWVTELVSGDRFDPDVTAERLRHGIGQVTRIGASTGLRPAESAALMNDIQRVAVEGTRLGIPVVVHEESTGGYCGRDATVFPQGIGLASTWDPALVEEVAGVIRDQLRAVGARLTLAPVLDVAREPRWGRAEETYGEDPFLAGAMGTAYVRGMQTDDLAGGVIATGKHFLGYAVSDGGRNHGPVHLGPRELREVHAEPFAAAIRDAGLAAVMNSYSSVDGLPCASSHAILTGLLRDELGFEGVVVADYFSVVLLRNHHRTATGKGEAAVAALSAGLDVELPSLDCYGDPLRARVEAGAVPMEVVDTAVRRVLEGKVRLGLFERPYVDADAAGAVFQTPPQRALARRAAAASVVLLTNDGVLPLGPDLSSVAVIGPGADDQRLLQGDYHYPAHVEIVYESDEDAGGVFLPEAGGAFAPGPYFTPHTTPLAGIQAAAPPGCRVEHAPGCEVSGDDRSDIPAAVALAQEAEVAVVVVAGRSGLRPACTVGEFRDATSLDLTGVQAELVSAVAATGTPIVVVVLSGRVHTLAGVVDDAGAVLQVWPPGEEGGAAVADVLFGAVNPAGRLPVTLPRNVGQLPVHHGQRAGGDRSQFLGDYTDSPTAPLFAFGHGLSYTTFEYGELEVAASSTDAPVEVSVRVANTGDHDGDEVVQLYGRDEVASVARPDSLLLGFARVPIPAGEARTVTFTVHPSRLAFYDAAMRFVVEPGGLSLHAGASSADLRSSARVVLDGDVIEHRQREVVATQVTITAG